jgi:hypothetical protein
MKFSAWLFNKNKNLREFWQGFPSDSDPGELDDPFASGSEDAEPVSVAGPSKERERTDWSPEEIEAAQELDWKRKEKRQNKAAKRAMKKWRALQKRRVTSGRPPDEILSDAKQKMLLLRYKSMYERKKRIEEIKDIKEKGSNESDLRRIFDLLVELEYLRPPGVKGGPRGGDVFDLSKPSFGDRFNKAATNAIKETGNDYPQSYEQLLSQYTLDKFENDANRALEGVFASNIIPYEQYTGQAIKKIINSAKRRRVTSFALERKAKEHKELRAKEWSLENLLNEKEMSPQEIKKIIKKIIKTTESRLLSDQEYKTKEKTTGQTGDQEVVMDPTKLAASKEKAPQMTVAQMDRLERVEKINQAIKNSFNKLHRSNSNAFEIVSEFLGLNYDSMGNIEIPEDISPLYKQIQTGQSTKPDTDELSRRLSQKIGYRGEVNKDRLGKIIRDSLKIIQRELASELANLDLGWRGAARGTLGTQSEVTFYDWLIING